MRDFLVNFSRGWWISAGSRMGVEQREKRVGKSAGVN
jgi:hypothetical protein